MSRTLFEKFKATLGNIYEEDIKKNPDYDARTMYVYEALALAYAMGLNAGIRIDPKEPEWPVVFIDLPFGQVSWHVAQFDREWDGHDTITKIRRVEDYIDHLTDEGI